MCAPSTIDNADIYCNSLSGPLSSPLGQLRVSLSAASVARAGRVPGMTQSKDPSKARRAVAAYRAGLTKTYEATAEMFGIAPHRSTGCCVGSARPATWRPSRAAAMTRSLSTTRGCSPMRRRIPMRGSPIDRSVGGTQRPHGQPRRDEQRDAPHRLDAREKTLVARERDTAAVQARRAAFLEAQPRLDVKRLIFVEQSGRMTTDLPGESSPRGARPKRSGETTWPRTRARERCKRCAMRARGRCFFRRIRPTSTRSKRLGQG